MYLWTPQRKEKLSEELADALKGIKSRQVGQLKREKAQAEKETHIQKRKVWITAIVLTGALLFLSVGSWVYYARHLGIVEQVVPQVIVKDKPVFWRDLPKEERDTLTAYGFVFFPEIFGKGYRTKYRRYMEWLLEEQGIVNSNVKNAYSAGGLRGFHINGAAYIQIPHVFTSFQKHAGQVFEIIRNTPGEELGLYWGEVPKEYEDRVWYWYSLVEPQALQTLDGKPFDFKGLVALLFEQSR